MSTEAHPGECSGCGKVFTFGGLTHHQATCTDYIAHRERLLGRLRARTKTFVPFGNKRRRVEETVSGSSAAEPSNAAAQVAAVRWTSILNS